MSIDIRGYFPQLRVSRAVPAGPADAAAAVPAAGAGARVPPGRAGGRRLPGAPCGADRAPGAAAAHHPRGRHRHRPRHAPSAEALRLSAKQNHVAIGKPKPGLEGSGIHHGWRQSRSRLLWMVMSALQCRSDFCSACCMIWCRSRLLGHSTMSFDAACAFAASALLVASLLPF